MMNGELMLIIFTIFMENETYKAIYEVKDECEFAEIEILLVEM